jgi:4-hydroxy-3-polyprenylbenzoate decarboxylase
MDLQQFVRRLDDSGELLRISRDVTPMLEITEITDRISKTEGGGKAMLFENTGTRYPLLINSLGSFDRLRIAFGGRSPDELALKLQALISDITGTGSGWMGKIKKLPLLGKASRWFPKKSKGRGLCQQITEPEPDLGKLPILTCWPHDGGPFITLPLVHTVDPLTGSPNLGMYRMQVFSKDTTGMHWHMHKTGAKHYRAYRDRKQVMPVAVALGGDPVYTYCATAPLPDGIDEYLLAGFIRNKPVKLVRCITQDLWVPDDCDFVIEGFVDPKEPLKVEGPFGDHTGFYSLEDEYPVFHVTAITHRKNAVYPATVVGIPPQEDAWIAWATERLFEPLIRMSLVPELRNFHMPVPGVAHNLVLASIDSSYPGQGRKVLHTLWGAGQMMFSKFVIITGKEAILTDYKNLARYISERIDPSMHIVRSAGPLDVLDHSSAEPAFGGKLGMDATGPILDTGSDQVQLPNGQTVASFRSAHPEIADLNLNWIHQGISLALVAIRKGGTGIVGDLINDIRMEASFDSIRFWLFFDDSVNLRNSGDLLWLAGSNTNTTDDIRIYEPKGDQRFGILFLDATTKTNQVDGFKRPWPNPVVMNAETIGLVNRKWSSYGIGNLIPSPSEYYSNLVKGGGARIKS